jgi:L-aspartate oxidase
MWTHVGIVRSDRRLQQALREVTLLHDAIEKLFHSTRITEGTIELRNIALVGQLIIRSALMRKESRGLNTNVDHPGRDDVDAVGDTVLVKEDRAPR